MVVVSFMVGCRQVVRHQTLTLVFVGSNPAIPAKHDPLAQAVEHLTFNQGVRGSSPRWITKNRSESDSGRFFQFNPQNKC